MRYFLPRSVLALVLGVASSLFLLSSFGYENFAFADAHVAGGGFSHAGGSGGIPRRRMGGTSVFPKYPARVVNHVPSHVDSLGNRVTEDHMSRVGFADNHAEHFMRNNVHVTDVVRVGRARYTNFYRPAFDHKAVLMDGFLHHYNSIILSHPVYLDVWHNHYFFGGLYWGFHPILNIDTYFYNPMVYWFYVGAYEEAYYRNWYKTQYDAYPELHQPFEYHGVYYPTENLRQLLFGVSAMTVDKQVRFREAINIFTQRIAQRIANGLGVHVNLSNGDIVVTHYEVIGYDDAIDLEGIVNFGGNGYNFKGLVDLEVPDQTDVFVPATWDKNPSPEQLSRLDALNAKINAIKGEPAQSSSVQPEPVMAAPSPGQVNAEPQPEEHQ